LRRIVATLLWLASVVVVVSTHVLVSESKRRSKWKDPQGGQKYSCLSRFELCVLANVPHRGGAAVRTGIAGLRSDTLVEIE